MTTREKYSRYIREGSTIEWIQAVVVKATVEVTVGVLLGLIVAGLTSRYLTPIDDLASEFGTLGETAFGVGVVAMSVYYLTLCTYINSDIGAHNDLNERDGSESVAGDA